MLSSPSTQSGVRPRRAAGIKRYADLPASLVEMLRAAVDARPDAEALVEVDGPRVTYRRAVGRRGAGGGWPARGGRRARRSRRDPPATASTGCSPSSGRSWPARWPCRSTPASPRPRSTYVVDDSGAGRLRDPAGRCRTAGVRRRGPRARGPRGDLLHERHDGLPEGRDDLARELPRQHRERLARASGCRPRGPGLRNARLGAAVPRHRLQQPAARRRCELGGAHRHHARPSRSTASCDAIVEERITVVTSVPAIFWLAITPPDFADFDLSAVRWVVLRRRADRARPRAADQGGVPERARRQRLRADRDLVGVDVPAARVRRRARRLGRLRGAGRRPRRRSSPTRRRASASC